MEKQEMSWVLRETGNAVGSEGATRGAEGNEEETGCAVRGDGETEEAMDFKGKDWKSCEE